MDKKIFPYIPARIVKCPSRWYILFYQTDPCDGVRKEFQRTFDINRVKDKRERLRMANEIVRKLNTTMLPAGYPFAGESDNNDIITKLQRTPITAALDVAYRSKTKSGKRNTVKTYRTPRNHFLEFLNLNKLEDTSIGEFTAHMAFLFVDYIELTVAVQERAFNNYIRMMRGMFKHLVKRQYLNDNPFAEVEYKKAPPKVRRNFTDAEKKWMFRYLYDNDRALFRFVLLMYYCALRIEDCQGLKLRWFDFKRGLILLPSVVTKNANENCKTIPASIIQYFSAADFIGHHGHYYAFGEALCPDEKRSGTNTPYNRHRKVLLEMEKELSTDISGLSLYSWRDTAATDHLASVANPLFVQDQFNHSDLKTTMIYRHKDPVNVAFRELPFDFLS